ncbi:hypothetical protein L2X99_13000 [Microbacterium sp. KUDC0406]|nr:hypothetical protein [Microbacterium sp. KUDC0406]UJP09345.1 hypothetical protein L2X99_13000 [Microbacterium sp. KUDC0406]
MVQDEPSAEPWKLHSWGSRAGTSFALVRVYEATSAGFASSACQITCAGGPSMHHFVRESPS